MTLKLKSIPALPDYTNPIVSAQLANIKKVRSLLSKVDEQILEKFKTLSMDQFLKTFKKFSSNDYKLFKRAYHKIAERAELLGISEFEILNEAKQSTLVSSYLAIDAKRQNQYEPIFFNGFKYLETELDLIHNFKHLTVGGNDAKYLFEGKVYGSEIKTVKQIKKIPHSIDFYWEYRFKGKTAYFYASHKYTKNGGGSQAHQLDDLEDFAKHECEFEHLNSGNEYFMSIADGPYYTNCTYPHSHCGEKIMDAVTKRWNSKHFHFVSCKNFVSTMLNDIEGWLKENFSKAEIKNELTKIHKLRKLVEK